MKTPMQELIETFEEMRSPIDSKVDVDFAISLVKSMLEKEKEVLMKSYQDGLDNGFANGNWDLNLWYNETFKTKEK
jgi:hypothetical protein